MADGNLTTTTGNTPALSVRDKSSADLTQAIHSPGDEEYTLNRTRTCLKLYYDPDMSATDRAEMIDSYAAALRSIPKWAVAQAFNQWERDKTHRPSPANLVGLANAAIKRMTDELSHRRKMAERPVDKPAKTVDELANAERALQRAGFTAKKFDMVGRKRMATTEAELYQHDMQDRVPHWTEKVGADDPKMEALRRARAENPIMAEAMRVSGADDDDLRHIDGGAV